MKRIVLGIAIGYGVGSVTALGAVLRQTGVKELLHGISREDAGTLALTALAWPLLLHEALDFRDDL